MSTLELERFFQIKEEILREFSLEPYQIKYLFHILYEKKPQYELVRFIKKEEPCKAELGSEYRYRNENQIIIETKDICIQMEVHDTIERRKKFIQIFLLETSDKTTLEKLQEKVRRVNTIGQVDLVMNPIDSYILKSEISVRFSKDAFFVVEYEMFDMTLRQFCKSFNIERNSIIDLLSQQQIYCQDICYLQITKTDPQFLFDIFYIKIENPQKIKFLLNLIHRDTIIYFSPQIKMQNNNNNNNNNKEQNQQEQKVDMIDENIIDNQMQNLNQMIPENNQMVMANALSNIGKDESQQLESKLSMIKTHSLNLKSTKFEDMTKNMKMQFSKNELTEQLPVCFPIHYSKHNQEIFQIISQQPKYSSFEVLTMDNYSFTFKIFKKDQTFCFIEGIKFDSLNEAQKQESQYQSLINSETPNKRITNVTSIQLFMFTKQTYVLKEMIERVSLFKLAVSNLNHTVRVILDNKITTNYIEARQILIENINLLEELMDLCYSLITKGQVSIHTINPENIYIRQWIKKQNGEFEVQLMIDSLQVGESFIVEYYQLFEQIVERLYYFSVIKRYVLDLLDHFFQAVSLQNQLQVKITYGSIQAFFQSMKKLIEFETQIFKSGDNKIWFADQFLEKLNIQINLPEKKDIDNYQKIIFSEHQYNFIDLNFKVKEIYDPDQLKYDYIFRKEKYQENLLKEEYSFIVQQHLGEQKINIISQFFPKEEQSESRKRLINTLVFLCRDLSKSIMLEIKEYEVNYNSLIFMWQDEKEFQFVANDNLMDDRQCLELTITQNDKFTIRQNDKQQKMKFIKTQKRFLAIISESPNFFIGVYQRYMNNIGMILLLKQAEFYQNFALTNQCQEDFQMSHCCEFRQKLDLQLLFLQNQKSLQGLKLSLELDCFRCCERINHLLPKYSQLRYLNLTLFYNKYQNYNFHGSEEKKFCLLLRNLLLPLKNLNYLQLDSKGIHFNNDRFFRYKMMKFIKLVRVDFTYYA